MKKALQKIATVALVIVGFLVTLFLLLVTLGAFDFAAYIDGNRVVHSLVIVLAIIYTVLDRKSTRLNSSHSGQSRMPSSA